MIYPIVAYGDPVLKKRAEEINKGSLDLPKIIADMYETMYSSKGIGLAAPQIGLSVRLFIIDAEPMDEELLKGMKKVFINPVLLHSNGDLWAYEEGCLSIPGIREKVYRQAELTLKYLDENWVEHTETFSGLLARVIQHEYDHLEGKLFIDYLSVLKKRLLQKKLNNITKGIVEVDYRMKFPVPVRK
jgi:peptide deformylase